MAYNTQQAFPQNLDKIRIDIERNGKYKDFIVLGSEEETGRCVVLALFDIGISTYGETSNIYRFSALKRIIDKWVESLPAETLKAMHLRNDAYQRGVYKNNSIWQGEEESLPGTGIAFSHGSTEAGIHRAFPPSITDVAVAIALPVELFGRKLDARKLLADIFSAGDLKNGIGKHIWLMDADASATEFDNAMCVRTIHKNNSQEAVIVSKKVNSEAFVRPCFAISMAQVEWELSQRATEYLDFSEEDKKWHSTK